MRAASWPPRSPGRAPTSPRRGRAAAASATSARAKARAAPRRATTARRRWSPREVRARAPAEAALERGAQVPSRAPPRRPSSGRQLLPRRRASLTRNAAGRPLVPRLGRTADALAAVPEARDGAEQRRLAGDPTRRATSWHRLRTSGGGPRPAGRGCRRASRGGVRAIGARRARAAAPRSPRRKRRGGGGSADGPQRQATRDRSPASLGRSFRRDPRALDERREAAEPRRNDDRPPRALVHDEAQVAEGVGRRPPTCATRACPPRHRAPRFSRRRRLFHDAELEASRRHGRARSRRPRQDLHRRRNWHAFVKNSRFRACRISRLFATARSRRARATSSASLRPDFRGRRDRLRVLARRGTRRRRSAGLRRAPRVLADDLRGRCASRRRGRAKRVVGRRRVTRPRATVARAPKVA